MLWGDFTGEKRKALALSLQRRAKVFKPLEKMYIFPKACLDSSLALVLIE